MQDMSEVYADSRFVDGSSLFFLAYVGYSAQCFGGRCSSYGGPNCRLDVAPPPLRSLLWTPPPLLSTLPSFPSSPPPTQGTAASALYTQLIITFLIAYKVAFEMDAVSMAAVTATRPSALGVDSPIPPTDLLVLHSAAKLSLYVASRHVCDIRLRNPGWDGGFSPYSSFLRGSQTIPKQAESPGEYVCASLHTLGCSQCTQCETGGAQIANKFSICTYECYKCSCMSVSFSRTPLRR